MSSNDVQIREIIPGGPEPQPNIPTGRDALLDAPPGGVKTFAQGRVVDTDPFAEPPRAEDTMSGATSKDVHNGLGHPGSGMTSQELHSAR